MTAPRLASLCGLIRPGTITAITERPTRRLPPSPDPPDRLRAKRSWRFLAVTGGLIIPEAVTFDVTEGADILGCTAGTFEDMEPVGVDVNRVMTCSDPDAGTFTVAFDPDGYATGPGEANGPWRVVDAGDFADLHGDGDWWAIGVSETLVGEIAYDS